MASSHQHQQYVVVWECLNHPSRSRWKPYSPSVSQILEKAFRSKLTQVLLGDADPLLNKLRVSFTSMAQICEFKEEVCPVRRMLHPRSSPAGQGIRWDWLGNRHSEWIDYDMDTQTFIEEGWTNGFQTLDLSLQLANMPYIINFCNLTQVRKDTGFVRSVRRVQQATYPAAMKNEMPDYLGQAVASNVEQNPVTHKAITPKGNWLSGLMNVVKPPSKSSTESKANLKPSSVVPNIKKTSRRSRKETKPGLRLERRDRSSSLETVSTCISQEDSYKYLHSHVKTNSRPTV